MKVLVVDDDPDARLLLETVLQSYACEVDTALNGRDAIERIALNVPDGVFMDVRMPGMDGFETLDVLRRQHPQLSIVITSASSAGEVATRAKERGAVAYLPKPITLSELRNVLHDFLGWRA
jgi:CheY-like chemotaxis protein